MYVKAGFIAALLVARAQRSTLRHAQQENNEVIDDRAVIFETYGSWTSVNFQAQRSREWKRCNGNRPSRCVSTSNLPSVLNYDL